MVASVLAPRPARRSGARAASTAPSLRPPGAPAKPPLVPARGLDDARRIARRFLAGYLRLLYGRPTISAKGISRAFSSKLTRTGALVTPVERRRHPRLVSLSAVGPARGVVVATAVVADGGVTTYALRISVRRGRAGWRVSSVSGG